MHMQKQHTYKSTQVNKQEITNRRLNPLKILYKSYRNPQVLSKERKRTAKMNTKTTKP